MLLQLLLEFMAPILARLVVRIIERILEEYSLLPAYKAAQTTEEVIGVLQLASRIARRGRKRRILDHVVAAIEQHLAGQTDLAAMHAERIADAIADW